MGKKEFSRIISYILDILYPRRCAICDTILRKDEICLCSRCRQNLPIVKGPVCMKCGRPLDDDTKEYCKECRRRDHLFDQGCSPLLYRRGIQPSMMRFKYGSRPEYGEFYGRAIWGFAKRQLQIWKPDVIIPVPLHRSRYRKRGYNQAALIAGTLSKLSGIPMDETLVVRTRKTAPQKGLTGSGRRKNLKDAFEVRKESGKEIPRTILLVDDIYTTGSTMDALSEVLKKSGVKNIYFVTGAIAPGES